VLLLGNFIRANSSPAQTSSQLATYLENCGHVSPFLQMCLELSHFGRVVPFTPPAFLPLHDWSAFFGTSSLVSSLSAGNACKVTFARLFSFPSTVGVVSSAPSNPFFLPWGPAYGLLASSFTLLWRVHLDSCHLKCVSFPKGTDHGSSRKASPCPPFFSFLPSPRNFLFRFRRFFSSSLCPTLSLT